MAKQTVKRSVEVAGRTLEEAFNEFYEEKVANGKSKSTLRNYEKSYEKFCNYYSFNETTLLSDITAKTIYQWQNHMKNEGLGFQSINHYTRDLRSFIYWCMEDVREYLPMFKIKEVSGQEEQIKFYYDDEIDLLLKKPDIEASFVEWRTWAIVNTCYATGLRAGSIRDIKLPDVDFGVNGELTISHTKNKKAFKVYMVEALQQVLKEYIKIWRSQCPKTAYLFPNSQEEQLTHNALRLSFDRYCESRGVEGHGIHALRHSFARTCVRNGMSLYELQQALGQSSLKMASHYVKLFGTDLKDNYIRFNPLSNYKRSTQRTTKVKRSK